MVRTLRLLTALVVALAGFGISSHVLAPPNVALASSFEMEVGVYDLMSVVSCSQGLSGWAGQIPPGVKLKFTGSQIALIGKPSKPGIYNFSVVHTDCWGSPSVEDVTVTVYPKLMNRTARSAKVWQGRSVLVPLVAEGGKSSSYNWILEQVGSTPVPLWASIVGPGYNGPEGQCSNTRCLKLSPPTGTPGKGYKFAVKLTDLLGTSRIIFTASVPSALPKDPQPGDPALSLGNWPINPMTKGVPVPPGTTLTYTAPPKAKILRGKVWGEKLPPGINVDALGRIKGKPSKTGTYRFHLMLVDPYQRTYLKEYNVTVNP